MAKAATTTKPRRGGRPTRQATKHKAKTTPAAVSLSELRRLKACRACDSTKLAPTNSLVGHMLALGVYALGYPRGKMCKDRGWAVEASY